MTPLSKGDAAPDFEVADHEGNIHRLSDYKGRKLVIFFYPRADTPGCTAEACNLRDNFERFRSGNYALLGVSADTPKKQSRFASKFQLPFPLLADVDKTMINAYGVWGPKTFMGRLFEGIQRTTFVIDEGGIIEDVITSVKTKAHADQILK